eukprot:6172589-Pleurochrysis_carterae.AAC.2
MRHSGSEAATLCNHLPCLLTSALLFVDRYSIAVLRTERTMEAAADNRKVCLSLLGSRPTAGAAEIKFDEPDSCSCPSPVRIHSLLLTHPTSAPNGACQCDGVLDRLELSYCSSHRCPSLEFQSRFCPWIQLGPRPPRPPRRTRTAAALCPAPRNRFSRRGTL